MTINSITAGNASAPLATAGGNDGTFQLTVGPVGAQVAALAIDAQGRVSTPLNVVAFSAYLNTGQVVGAATKIQCGVKEFDTTNAFDGVTNFRFQPAIPGYYQLIGSVQGGSTSSIIQPFIYKNGAGYKSGNYVAAATGFQTAQILVIIYLNGTTDFAELWGSQSVSQALTSGAGNGTYFHGTLIAKA